LDVGTILGNRRIESMEKIPESFDHDGNVVLPAPQNGVMRGR
jgi:hypothetical protein